MCKSPLSCHAQFAAGAALLLGLCASLSLGDERPNIVWINCEDLDDALGCYGDDYATTPNIDKLASQGVLFRNALANAPICAPARSCLITGMYPTSLGSQHLRCEIELPKSIRPFPLELKDAGYFVTSASKTDFNFSAEGVFDHQSNSLAPWRQRRGDQPFFSFIVLGTTHEGPANDVARYREAVASLPKESLHDAARARVPPYFPDSPKMRELWARYYDLASAMDRQVGEVLANLEHDGLSDSTIVWFFSDHGFGFPRHKRWLLDSGLRVPLIMRIPPAFRRLAGGLAPGSESSRLVSFVDFAPTVLSQAGLTTPANMQGVVFAGDGASTPREFAFASRDRADDMYELSRAVHSGRYVYVRHFMPHLPYVQGGEIMWSVKESMAELRRARDAGELTDAAQQIWRERKPLEEFFDLSDDPHELRNLADDPAQASRIAEHRAKLREWILKYRDVGFLPEAEAHLRAERFRESIFEMAQDPNRYDLEKILAAAETVGRTPRRADLEDSDSGVRYWGVVALQAQEQLSAADCDALTPLLGDASPSVAIAAAETLCQHERAAAGALPVLERYIGDAEPRVAMQAARAMFQIGDAARPAAGRIEAVRKSLEGPPNPTRRYRDFNYASFTGWSLEWALINCGAASPEDFR